MRGKREGESRNGCVNTEDYTGSSERARRLTSSTVPKPSGVGSCPDADGVSSCPLLTALLLPPEKVARAALTTAALASAFCKAASSFMSAIAAW